ncbi:MAG: helix-turn-helix transcriptional regulator, partial [Luteimonas sp.]
GNALADGDGAGAMQPLLLHLQSLQASLHERADRCPGRTDVRRRQVLARMQRVHMCMQGNTHRSVRLAELAEMTRFSEWWVSKTYRAIYGETVQEASLRLRLRRACALLEHSGLSISEVGEACGFHDPCSFARLFKRRHGQTASRWRETGQARRQTGPRQSPDFPPVVGRMGA